MNTVAGTGLVIGAILGFFIDPDLDHEWQTHSEGRINRLFGKQVGKLWRMRWAPYEIAFDHRSPWTHGGSGFCGMLMMMFVACPIRMAYALMPELMMLSFLLTNWDNPLTATIRHDLAGIPLQSWALLLTFTWFAWAIQDGLHWVRDYC